MSFDIHSFWCMRCGRRGIPLPRPLSRTKERFHRKKMYCIFCGLTINHVECKNDIDIAEFKELFNSGYFQEEAEISLKECAENG